MLGTTLKLSDIAPTLRQFQNEETAVHQNSDLSAEGKRKEAALIQNRRREFRAPAVNALTAEYDRLMAAFNANDARRKAAQEAEATRWNYERLNYSATAAAAKVQRADSLAAVRDLYQAAKNSGDQHTYRAFAEVGAEAVQARWGGPDPEGAAMLVKSMERDLKALTQTAELQACNTAGTALANQAMDLRGIADTCRGLWGGEYIGIGSGNDEFSWIIEGIEVRYLDGDTPGFFKTNVTMIPLAEVKARHMPHLQDPTLFA